jgi:hypothetical protein
VFLLMVPESACIPILSEVTLLFSGFAVHQGWMSLPLAVGGPAPRPPPPPPPTPTCQLSSANALAQGPI